MSTSPASTTEAALIQLHTATCAEVSRYRDREWHNQGIFTGAIIGILGFILANRAEAQQASRVFDAALVLLAIGNIVFTLFVTTPSPNNGTFLPAFVYFCGSTTLLLVGNLSSPQRGRSPQVHSKTAGFVGSSVT